jgi:hypothetical protein
MRMLLCASSWQALAPWPTSRVGVQCAGRGTNRIGLRREAGNHAREGRAPQLVVPHVLVVHALREVRVESVAKGMGTFHDAAPVVLRRQDPIKLRGRTEPLLTKALCAVEHGFSLHAATTARVGDAAGREALCRYILRPPVAQERIQLVADDLVRLVLKKPFSDGTFAFDLDPLALLCRLCTTIPPPRFNTVRYAGVLAAASKWRARVVPPPPAQDNNDDDTSCATCAPKDKPPTHRCGYRPWRELLRRSFKIDVERCDNCGGRMKLRALVITSAGIERYLRWLGEPTEPPALAPARGPPWFKSHVIRRRLGEPVQAELFDAH